MALPTYASPLERIWYYTYIVICVLVFLFLIAPILIVIPLSFNAEPYFTFTPKMLTFDPEGYSLRWYDALLTLGHPNADAVRDSAWWATVWERSTWVQAAKNSFWVGMWATILATTLGTIAALGLSRPEMPYRRLIMALMISPMIVPIIIIAVGMSFFYAKACVAPDSVWFSVFGMFLSDKGCLANSHLGVIVGEAPEDVVEDLLGEDGAHVPELQQVLRAGVRVRTRIDQHGRPPAGGDDHGDPGTERARQSLHVQERGRQHGAGVPGRDDRVRIAVADRAHGPHQRGVGPGAHRLGRLVVHRHRPSCGVSARQPFLCTAGGDQAPVSAASCGE